MTDTFPRDPQAPQPKAFPTFADPWHRDLFPTHPGPRATTVLDNVALPTQGRAERAHLYGWISEEERYVADKFDDQRSGHDDSLKNEGMNEEGFWFRQIVQYLDRARIAFQAAHEFRQEAERLSMTDESQHGHRRKYEQMTRVQEMKAQQALAKAMMTAKGCVESSIRVFGPLPKPGLSSGNVEDWT